MRTKYVHENKPFKSAIIRNSTRNSRLYYYLQYTFHLIRITPDFDQYNLKELISVKYLTKMRYHCRFEINISNETLKLYPFTLGL